MRAGLKLADERASNDAQALRNKQQTQQEREAQQKAERLEQLRASCWGEIRFRCQQLVTAEHADPTWRWYQQPHTWFNTVSVLLIVSFSILLAFTDPLQDEDSPGNQMIADAEKVFTVIFTMEVSVSWIGLGCIGFLRSAWNLLDLIVVVGGWLAFTPFRSSGLGVLRSIRLLRPLRTLKRIKGIKRLVDCLFESLPGLAEVCLLIAAFICVFGLFGLKLWKGEMRYRCVEPADASAAPPGACELCSPDYVCELAGNPNFGFSSFDNLGAGCLLVFQVITLEGWTDLMDVLADVSSLALVSTYFVLVVGCGAFFLMNYLLAQICMVFTWKLKVKQQLEETKAEQLRLELERKQTVIDRFSSAAAEARVVHGQNALREDAPILHLTVVRATGLAPMDTVSRSSDPYAVITLEGDDQVRHQTSTQRRTLDPEWQEGFDLRLSDEKGQMAVVRLYDSNFAASDEPMGRVKILLDKQTNDVNEIIERWLDLESEAGESENNGGRLLMRLQWRPNDGGKLKNDDRKVPQMEKLVTSKPVGIFVDVCIIVNFLIMAAEYHGMDRAWVDAFEIINLVLTVIFATEMVAKMAALGLVRYFKDKFNQLDCFIVTTSAVELVMDAVSSAAVSDDDNGSSGGGLTVLRTFRLLRILRSLKLIQSVETLKNMIATTGSSLTAIANFAVLLLIVLYIYALCGLTLFGGQMVDDVGETPRANFDSLLDSITTVFIVMTRENWQETLYIGMRYSGWRAVPFFVTLIFITNYILLSLFVGTLLENFERFFLEGGKAARPVVEFTSTTGADALPVVHAIRFKKHVNACTAEFNARKAQLEDFNLNKLEDVAQTQTAISSVAIRQATAAEDPKGTLIAMVMHEELLAKVRGATPSFPIADVERAVAAGDSAVALIELLAQRNVIDERMQQHASVFRASLEDFTHEALLAKANIAKIFSEEATLSDNPRAKVIELLVQDHMNKLSEKWHDKEDSEPLSAKPLGWLRQKLRDLVFHRVFEAAVLVAIFVSSGCLAFEHPLDDPDSTKAQFLRVLDVFFLVLFSAEMLLKFGALGIVRPQGAYFRSTWNWIDFVCVVTSLIIVTAEDAGSMKAVRSIRILRPLRAIQRSRGMRTSVSTLLNSVPAIMTVGACLLFFCSVVAIFCVQLFKGVFVDEMTGQAVSIPTWENTPQNFDNFGNAMLSLFELFTLEAWPDLLFAVVDATDVAHGPVKNNNQLLVCLLFFVLVTFGGFFLMNLFIGVIVTAYNEAQLLDPPVDKETEELPHDESLGQARSLQPKMLFQTNSPCRRKLVVMINSDWFELLAMGAIVVNILVMCVDWADMEEDAANVLDKINLGFTILFAIEAAIKLLAVDIRYFCDGWNIFDFLIVVSSLLEEFLEEFSDVNFNPTMIRIFRVFRLARLLRLSRKAAWAQQLASTISSTLPSLMHVSFLLMLFFFMYAVLGVQLFFQVKHGDVLTRHADFSRFSAALYTLFRISTGENWNPLMHELMISPPHCTPASDDPAGHGDCGTGVAIVYFISFTLLCALTTLNLIVAVILYAFFELSGNRAGQEAKYQRCLTKKHFSEFQNAWMGYDPAATGQIPAIHTVELLQRIPVPLGVIDTAAAEAKAKLLLGHSLSMKPDKDQCKDTSAAHLQVVSEEEQQRTPNIDQEEERVSLVANESTFNQQNLDKTIGFTQVLHALVEGYIKTDPRVMAARVVQRAWRRKVAQRKGVVRMRTSSTGKVTQANSLSQTSMPPRENHTSSNYSTATKPTTEEAAPPAVRGPTSADQVALQIEDAAGREEKLRAKKLAMAQRLHTMLLMRSSSQASTDASLAADFDKNNARDGPSPASGRCSDQGARERRSDRTTPDADDPQESEEHRNVSRNRSQSSASLSKSPERTKHRQARSPPRRASTTPVRRENATPARGSKNASPHVSSRREAR